MTASRLLPLLALLLIMTACQTLTIGRTSDADIRAAEQRVVERTCKEAWLPTDYDSEHDTPETVEGNRANNRARDAYCK